MKKHDRRQRGFSLAEVLVATAIFALIILASLMVYDRSNRIFKTGVESSNLQQNTRVAFDKLLADVRMAGYDFDRDGIPAGSVGGTNVYQQPDEQLEYIGPAAVAMRGNFDYETENQPCSALVTDNCDNGREASYENVQFPVVTTGNDEIVAYALVPDSQTAFPACNPATNCIKLYADTHIPRKSYPDPTNGGLDENVVEIPGVDLCAGGCNNPPYTLYRFTLDRSQQTFTNGANVIRTPLASNIRNLTFKYYQDAQGSDPLKDLPNTVDVSSGATVRGAGRFRVSNPSQLVPERSIRGKVNSIRVTLVGMNEARDGAYTDTAETVSGGPGYFEQYRKYRLETLVSPRNVQKRGMREQDTSAPGAPTIVSVCTGACGGIYLTWSAPAVNAVQGAPDQYKVIYDKVSVSGYNCETTTFTNTFTHVFGDSHASPSCILEPDEPYKFAVVALNSYGSATSGTVTATPLNTTRPSPPVLISSTNDQIGKITLTWSRPMTNVAPNAYTCGPQTPNAAELQGYRVEREDPATPGTWTPLLTAPSTVTVNSPYDTVTWADTSVANCVNYSYRVKARERCADDANYNNPQNATLGISTESNTLVGTAISGGFAPDAPPDLKVDPDALALCPGLICSVPMNWPPVTTDTALPDPGNTITVTRYDIERQQVGVGIWTTVGTITNGALTFTDTGVDISTGQQYRYRVFAVHCYSATPGTGRGGPSPERLWPCTITPGVLAAPLVTTPAAFDGDGSAGNPWKVVANGRADVRINLPGQINRVVGRDYDAASNSLKWQSQLNAPTTGGLPSLYSFTWPMTPNGVDRFDVTVVDNAGCAKQTSVYFQDEPQNCCLTPFTFDPSVVRFSSGNPYVDFVLKNICTTNLTINSLNFTWSSATTPGGTKVDRIVFPSAAGGCATDPTFGANCAVYNFSGSGVAAGAVAVPGPAGPGSLPGGILAVPAGTTTYRIRVHFTRSLTNPSQPVTAFTVNYANATGTAACSIK